MDPSVGFLDLPGELRNQIYEYLLVPKSGHNRVRGLLLDNYKAFKGLLTDPEDYDLDFDGPKPKAYNYETAIMATNRQIQRESSSLFHGSHRFILIETNSLALARVFFEADMMMIRTSMIQSGKPAATLALLWPHPLGGIRFHFMIPLAELHFLASLLFKANVCVQNFFNPAHLHVHLSYGLSCATQKRIGQMFSAPVKELYNVKKRIVGPGLRIHASHLMAIELCPLFDLNSLLQYGRHRLHISNKMYDLQQYDAAWQCCRSAIDDLGGGIRTNYTKMVEHQLRRFVEFDILQALMTYWLLRYQLALKLWTPTLYTATREIAIRRRFNPSEYRTVILIRLFRLRAATLINMGENTDIAVDDIAEAIEIAAPDPVVIDVLQADLKYAIECHEELLKKQPMEERTPELNTFFGYGIDR